MANPKIPQGYQGTYAHAADGSATLIMVSRSDSIADYTEKKEQKSMSEQQQPNSTFTPYTTEQKREFAKQFTPEQIKSYRKGQQNAYAHMSNIGRRNSSFIHNNLKNDEAATPPTPPPAEKPKSTRKNQTGNK
ncbi:MAG: hypothetical protein K2O67_02505 [Clostridia bacterium]|nr:hypothetical protein [Clostridia bacterium]